MSRTKIGIMIRLPSKENTIALKYLLLAQNLHQQSFEFELLPELPDDPFLKRLDSKGMQPRQEIEGEVPAFLERYKKWFRSDAAVFDLKPDLPDHTVFISKVRFDDHYYATGSAEWTVITLVDWHSEMAPPSAIEFVLTLVAEVATDIRLNPDFTPKHHTTKGCIFDFTADLDDARYKALTGYLCPACEAILANPGKTTELEDAVGLIKRNWLGSANEPSPEAIMAKKLGYDLFQTRGLTPSWSEKAVETLQEEWVNVLSKIIGGVALAALVVWLGLKAS